ncbi:X-ray repair cross complementing protein spindle B [Anticarsia gemmatalis]|uniref:X-ray repair cross complementing protein spindle B n=1 Tax=Anticarsia gemmatalis TaxID=129554 RepID=UPI003F762842
MSLNSLLPLGILEALDKAGIATVKQILILSVWDIKKYTNLSIDDINVVKNIVSDSLCPQIVTADCLKKEDSLLHTRIHTGCTAIDEVLKGGLRRGTITEIYGESGSGKTQLALQIVLNNWAKGSVYICTEDLFPTKRFEEMKTHLPMFDPVNVDYGKNIFVEHITETNDLLACISVRLPKLLEKTELSIVVIDSIAAPFRCESVNYIKRAEELREIAISLTAVAQKYSIAILCINQVTASFNETANVLPSLGLAWSNMVTTRIMIKKLMKTVDSDDTSATNYVREFSIMFAPDLPNAMVEFYINACGIQTL